MNSEMGFSLRTPASDGTCLRDDPRGARHWGASSRRTLHMRVGPSRLALIDVGGNLDKKPYCLIGECSRDVERCLTNRAPVASLVLRPSRSSFSVSLIKAY